MVTLKQIAAICGVSVTTVSKALNGAGDIGTATVERIVKTAEELGYHPNAAARSLVTRRTRNIGVLFEDDMNSGLTHEYFSFILNALKDEAETHGYDVTFISEKMGMRFLEHCRYRGCDGVVIANVDFEAPSVKELVASEIPVVTIDYSYEGRSSVVSDNRKGAADLLEYLVSLGNKRFAIIHGEKTLVTRNRIEGFKEAAERLGVTGECRWFEARYHDPKLSGQITKDLLESGDLPDCILYPDDISLLGGMTMLERSGLRIPQDIAIAGYDGIRLAELLRPRLTTLHQDSESLGREAIRLLLPQIEKNETECRRVIVPGSIMEGGTAIQRQ
ncbi:MAG: LacI family transcriptional regulator [Clostridia bacterium]|nr:LacI family transcriptional regulator [Clostridia bacterium]